MICSIDWFPYRLKVPKDWKEGEVGPGYQFVSVSLKYGRYFESAVASEGFIIQVKVCKDLPFTQEEVESVALTEKRWNFRKEKQDRPKG